MSVVIEREAIANKVVRKDEIWLADLGESKGSVQGGVRPVLVTSNNVGNKFSSYVVAVPITSSKTKAKLPTHVHIVAKEVGFVKDSVIMFEQSFTLRKDVDMIHKLIDIPASYYSRIDEAYAIAGKR